MKAQTKNAELRPDRLSHEADVVCSCDLGELRGCHEISLNIPFLNIAFFRNVTSHPQVSGSA
jgi:hypothetical protein